MTPSSARSPPCEPVWAATGLLEPREGASVPILPCMAMMASPCASWRSRFAGHGLPRGEPWQQPRRASGQTGRRRDRRSRPTSSPGTPTGATVIRIISGPSLLVLDFVAIELLVLDAWEAHAPSSLAHVRIPRCDRSRRELLRTSPGSPPGTRLPRASSHSLPLVWDDPVCGPECRVYFSAVAARSRRRPSLGNASWLAHPTSPSGQAFGGLRTRWSRGGASSTALR